MDPMTDRDTVLAQYATEDRLDTRRSVWRPALDGTSPHDLAARTIREAAPERILEVGCGTGAFAGRVAAENPQARVRATDQSARFVELAAARGVEASVADVQDLPFDDGGFDAVAAMWMLYHVPDLDLAITEIRRVLRPGGVLVAATNGDRHLARLLEEAGGRPLVTGFSSENGRDVLGRHFAEVDRVDVATRAVFETHAEAVCYLASFDEALAAALPAFDGPREYAGATSVFRAR